MKKVAILHTAHWQQAMGGAELQIKFLIENFLLQPPINQCLKLFFFKQYSILQFLF